MSITHDWFRKRTLWLKEDSNVMEKLSVITELQAATRHGFDLSHELLSFACLAVSPHQGRPAILERTWASTTGKTWKTLTDFPRQLDGIADEVQRINDGDHLFFGRRRRNDLDRCELERLREICEQLPSGIRSYADALRERNAAVAAVCPRNGRTEALVNLSETVKFLTGGYHDTEVARLLNAAAGALHVDREYDALSIAQARSRHRRRKGSV